MNTTTGVCPTLPFRKRPVTRIQTSVFARLPDALRKRVRTPWGDANKAGEPVDCFLEGSCFDARGNLYCTDIPHGRIFRIGPGAGWTLVAEYDGEPNGLKVRRDGSLVIADYRRRLLVVDPRRGEVEPLLLRGHSESFRGVNDLCIAANGDLYL